MDRQTTLPENSIAIVGMAGRFPGAGSLEIFWQNLCQGSESISFFSEEELREAGIPEDLLANPQFVRAKGILQGVEDFDAQFFGYTPGEARIIDPQQRLFLEIAWQALEHAGYDPDRYPGRIGLFASATMNTYQFMIREYLSEVDAFQMMLSNERDYLATRVAYKLNLTGPAVTVQTACSSSLVGVSLACQSLLNYQSDLALAGGISLTFPERSGYLYQEDGIGSPDGHCRAFSAEAQGAVFSNGGGVVVLKRLEDALAEKDQIYALILGSAINNDGSAKVGYTAPSVSGQARVITEALSLADVEAEEISYVETHGTGTPIGDPIEIAALTQAFRQQTQRRNFCALGSLKSNIGHLDVAAGIAGLLKTTLALFHEQLPPTLHAGQPNPRLELESSPFFLNTTLRPWPRNSVPRRAGVSSFGVGGTNAHVILQETPAVEFAMQETSTPSKSAESEKPRDETQSWVLLPLSARTVSAVQQQGSQLADYLSAHPRLDLADVAYTLQVGRRPFAVRTFVVAAETLEAQTRLKQAGLSAQTAPESAPPIAFLFPGGGAQHALMGYDLWRYDPIFRQHLEECVALFQPWLGHALLALLTDASLSLEDRQIRLRQTRWGLPALFSVEYALARRWLHWSICPQALIGHSLGEYVAACLAGVFSLQEAVTLVMQRSLLFERLPPGAMLNVELSEEEVLARLPAKLSLAACNTPRSCVVSGPQDALMAFAQDLQCQGLECRVLPIDVAAHSQQVDAILSPFVQQVQQFHLSAPQIPFISNVTGTWITAEQATDPHYWGQHLRQTVRFAAGIQSLLEQQPYLLLEVGPGRTLSSLAKQTLSSMGKELGHVFHSMRHPSQAQDDRQVLLEALGHLWQAGYELNGQEMGTAAPTHRRVPLPTYPFERQRYWVERQRPGGPATVPAGEIRELASWFYLPSWKRALPLPAAARSDEPQNWLIFVDNYGLGEVLAARLRARGRRVVLVTAGPTFARLTDDHYEIDPQQLTDYSSLAAALQDCGFMPQALVHGWSLVGARGIPGTIQGFQQQQFQGYYSLLWWVQAWEESGLLARSSAPTVFILTDRLCRVLPQDQAAPEQAPLLALCRVLQQEYLELTARCFDLSLSGENEEKCWSEAQISQLLAEFLSSEKSLLVAYRGPQRWLPFFEPLTRPPLRAEEQVIRERGVYLLTGGLGRVGQHLGLYLARRYHARLCVLSRTALPPRAAWSTWLAEHTRDTAISRHLSHVLALEEAGAEVLVVQADVSQEDEMERAFQAITARFGALHGVFHMAGLTEGDSFSTPLKDLSSSLVEQQWAAKIAGLYVLERALRGQSLDFCLLFSSNASVLGGIGFGAYGAANAFMDAFAASRENPDAFPWISANWDGWPLTREEQQRGVTLLQTSMAQYALKAADALEAVERILALRAAQQIVVSSGLLEPRLHRWIERAEWTRAGDHQGEAREEKAPDGLALHPRPPLRTAYVAPQGEYEQRLAAIWEGILGITGLGAQDNFFELGGDSVLGLQMIARARRAGLHLTITQLFQHQTIAEQAQISDLIQESQSRGETEEEAPVNPGFSATGISPEELAAVIAEFDR